MLRAVDKPLLPNSPARFYSLCKSNAHRGERERPGFSALNSLCQKPASLFSSLFLLENRIARFGRILFLPKPGHSKLLE